MLHRVAYDEHYGDIARMMADTGKLLRHNFQMLVEAGCRNIQIDEPLFTMADDGEVAAAVDAINLAIADLPDDVHVSTHICQGNYAVGKEYDGQIGHRYFDVGHYKADHVCRIECSSYLVEIRHGAPLRRQAGRPAAGRRRGQRAGSQGRGGETVAERIQACGWLAPEQTIITSSCGFNHLPRRTAFGKLQAMAEAKRMLGG